MVLANERAGEPAEIIPPHRPRLPTVPRRLPGLYPFICLGDSVKKVLLLPLLLFLVSACTSMEEERNALMENARARERSGDCAGAAENAMKATELDPLFTEGFLILGRCEMKADRIKPAEKHFGRVLELTPDSVEAMRNLARIAFVQGDLNRAGEYADKAAAFGDDSLDLAVLRGGVLMKKGEYAAAVPLLEKAVAADPADEEAVVGLASAYLNTEEPDKARALLEGAARNLPDSNAVFTLLLNMALQEDDLDAAEKYALTMLDRAPDDESVLLRLVDIALRGDEPEKAAGLLEDFVQGHPGASQARLRLAELYAAQNRFDKALEALRQAPERSDRIALYTASVLARSGRVNEAMALLKTLIADAKDFGVAVEARTGLAEIYLQKNQPEEAEKELSLLLEQDPGNLPALSMRGRTYAARRMYPEALADLQAVVKGEPFNLEALLALADAQNASGNSALAEQTITGIISRAPRFAKAYMALANLYLMRQSPEAALMTLSIGRNHAPDDEALPLVEADILTGLQRYDKARELLEEQFKKSSNKVMVLVRLAAVHGSAGDHVKAADAFNRALAIDPDMHMAAEGRVRALVAAKQPKEALAFAEKRWKERPLDPAAAYLAGESALANKDAKKAEKGFLRALELAPQWEQPLSTLMQLYASTGRINDAIALCRSIMAKSPDAVGPAVMLAMLQEQKGELTEAERNYRNVLIKDPEMVLAANNLAYLLTRHKPDRERLREAEELALIAASSGAPASLDTLGWVQHMRGKNVEAESNLRTAYEALNDNPMVMYHLATVLAALSEAPGNSEDAKAKRDEAVALLEALLKKYASFPYRGEAGLLADRLKKAK